MMVDQKSHITIKKIFIHSHKGPLLSNVMHGMTIYEADLFGSVISLCEPRIMFDTAYTGAGLNTSASSKHQHVGRALTQITKPSQSPLKKWHRNG